MTDFGYGTVGGSSDNPANNWVWCKCPSAPAADGSLTTLQLYCAIRSGAPTLAMAIYDDVSGAPHALVEANESAVSPGGSYGWVAQAFTAGVLTGVQYWLAMRMPAFVPTVNDINFKYDSNGGATELYYKAGGDIAVFPSTVPGGLSSATNERVSFTASYTAGPPPGTHVVSGVGSFSVSSPTWLSITTTGPLSDLNIGGANPPNYYHLGMLRWASANGVMTAYPITSDTDLVQLPAGMTTVYHTFRSGMTATIVELSAP